MSAIGKLLGKKCHLAKLFKLVKDSIFGINVSRWKTVGKKASPFKLTKLFQACKNIWNKCQPLEKSLGKKCHLLKLAKLFKLVKDSIFGINVSRWKVMNDLKKLGKVQTCKTIQRRPL